jgi:hypothetical protein
MTEIDTRQLIDGVWCRFPLERWAASLLFYIYRSVLELF